MLYFVDANIFLEIQLGDEKSEICKKLLRKIDKSEINAVISDFVVYTCLIQIQNKLRSPKEMNKFMIFLTNLEALEVFRPGQSTIQKGVEYCDRYKLDFDDGLVIACMVENNIKDLISFDKHFDKVKEINRIEPQMVV